MIALIGSSAKFEAVNCSTITEAPLQVRWLRPWADFKPLTRSTFLDEIGDIP
jgi:hypothetical protein